MSMPLLRYPHKFFFFNIKKINKHRLKTSWSSKRSSSLLKGQIQQANGPHEDLLTIVKRRKLQWYGHGSRSSGLAKTILQDTVKGERRQDRQRKRMEDNIRKWTGLEFVKSQRAVENRENRGNWLRHHVVPQRPSCSRDR